MTSRDDAEKDTSPFLERALEGIIYASRWLMAPVYLGLIAALAILIITFFREFYIQAPQVLTMDETDIILLVLTLVDLSLAGNLVLIILFSGYENFVSKIDHTDDRRWPEWMGSIDFTSLKIKLLGSIVAISAIQLLKQFMAVKAASDRELWWSTGIHLVFVVSSVLLALSDRLSASHVQPEGKQKAPPADGSAGTH